MTTNVLGRYRDFLDAEATLQGHQPFNWEEWSFIVERVSIEHITMVIKTMQIKMEESNKEAFHRAFMEHSASSRAL